MGHEAKIYRGLKIKMLVVIQNLRILKDYNPLIIKYMLLEQKVSSSVDILVQFSLHLQNITMMEVWASTQW